MTLDDAQDEFRESTNHGVYYANNYARTLIEYHDEGMIGNETLRNGLIEIAQRLTGGVSDMGGKVEVTVVSR
jgi:hypothetical protein